MQIICHRGLWEKKAEQNTLASFQRAFSAGCGFETDLRDALGQLVISHNPPVGDCLTVDAAFAEYTNANCSYPLALNIKADGLQKSIRELINKYQISNYFVFDMSIPDTIGYIDDGFRIFTRQSEFEPEPAFYQDVVGVWIDAFRDERWVTEKILKDHLHAGKMLCIVSPELHGRHHEAFWQNLSTYAMRANDNVMLCTDYPSQAREFFCEED